MAILDELAEVHHGQFAGLTNDDIEATYPGSFEARAREKYRWRFPGGESYADVDERAALALESIAASSARPLIVSHEMIGRMLLRHLLDLSPEDALSRKHPHNIVYRVDMVTAELTPLAVPGEKSSGTGELPGRERSPCRWVAKTPSVEPRWSPWPLL